MALGPPGRPTGKVAGRGRPSPLAKGRLSWADMGTSMGHFHHEALPALGWRQAAAAPPAARRRPASAMQAVLAALLIASLAAASPTQAGARTSGSASTSGSGNGQPQVPLTVSTVTTAVTPTVTSAVTRGVTAETWQLAQDGEPTSEEGASRITENPPDHPKTALTLPHTEGTPRVYQGRTQLAEGEGTPDSPRRVLLPAGGGPGLSERIVGSSIRPGEETAQFRERWRCLTSENTSHWQIDPTPRLLPWPEKPLGPCGEKKGFLGLRSNARVSRGEYTGASWNVSDGLKAVWRPRAGAQCGSPGAPPPSFVGFNGEEFCATMRKRGGSVFVIGDSFSAHFYMSLTYQLDVSGIPWKEAPPTAACAAFQAQVGKRCERLVACARSEGEAGAVMVHFVISVFLGNVVGYNESETARTLFAGLMIPEFAWGPEAARENASVVILNRGAHPVGTPAFARQIEYTFRELRGLLPGALLVYRSAQPRHLDCNNHTAPLDRTQDLQGRTGSWAAFQEQNELAKRAAEGVGGVFFDTAPMAFLRPDWHLGGKDCLHLCMPGPVTDWVTMFSKLLTELTSGVGATRAQAARPGGLAPGGAPAAQKGPELELGSAVGAKGVGAGEGDRVLVGGDGSEGGGAEQASAPPVEGILGTKIVTTKAASAFRERWKCLTSLEMNEWRIDPTPRGLPWPLKPGRLCEEKPGYLGPAANEAVASGEFNASHWPVADSLKYVWRTRPGVACGAKPAPSLVRFDAEEFCATMRRRGGSLFILGDSFGDFTWRSIRAQLALEGKPCVDQAPTPECAALWEKHGKRCEACIACGESEAQGGVRIHFVISNYLGKIYEHNAEQKELFHRLDIPELAWGEEAVRMNASVLIVNRGAHFVHHKPFEAQIQWSFKELRRLLPNALFIYRATAPGHPDCNNHKTPVDVPTKLPKGTINYWGEHEQQNKFAKEVVESAGGVFLDVAPLMSLRPEWHPGGHDCLHWCMPGPVDDWIKLMSKMLKELVG